MYITLNYIRPIKAIVMHVLSMYNTINCISLQLEVQMVTQGDRTTGALHAQNKGAVDCNKSSWPFGCPLLTGILY